MRERPDRAAAVFPRRARQPRETVLGQDSTLVESFCGKLSGSLVGLYGMRDDGREVHVAPEVAGEVAWRVVSPEYVVVIECSRTEVSGLFNDSFEYIAVRSSVRSAHASVRLNVRPPERVLSHHAYIAKHSSDRHSRQHDARLTGFLAHSLCAD